MRCISSHDKVFQIFGMIVRHGRNVCSRPKTKSYFTINRQDYSKTYYAVSRKLTKQFLIPVSNNKCRNIFEMAAMPFPCNGLCFVLFNSHTVLLMFSIIWLVVLSPLSIFFIAKPSFCFKQFQNVFVPLRAKRVGR